MLIRNTLIALTSALVMGTAVAGALRDKPPQGVKLSGTWRLDPDRSDDPAAVIERAAQAEQSRKQREMEDRENARRGGVFDPNDDWDRDGTWDDGIPGRRLPGDPRTRRDPFPDRRDRGDSSTIDPLGREGSVTWSTGGAGNVRNEFLLQLDPSPSMLTILDSGTRVSVSENRLETDCSAGGTEPIADSFGDGERRCGWGGRAWVIETTRTKRFKRTDRFELGKDGKVLTYVTTASGKQMPTIRVSRTYTWVPPAPAQ